MLILKKLYLKWIKKRPNKISSALIGDDDFALISDDNTKYIVASDIFDAVDPVGLGSDGLWVMDISKMCVELWKFAREDNSTENNLIFLLYVFINLIVVEEVVHSFNIFHGKDSSSWDNALLLLEEGDI